MMIPMTAPLATSSARLVPTEARVLPLRGVALCADARGGLARLVFTQRFENPHKEPLAVTYKLPLPADGAVSGFAFEIGERRVVGRVEGKKAAREIFEQAVMEGRTAALLEQERSSLFTQELGNIPPGAEIVAEIEIDVPLAYLAEGMWELRFPLAAAPRYLGSADIEGDPTLDIASSDVGARATLELHVRDDVPEGRTPESASHAIVPAMVGGAYVVRFGDGGKALLDRDVVVRWPAAKLEPTATIDVARPHGGVGEDAAFALLTLVPPLSEGKVAPVRRDLTLLLDTSGSMYGEPLEQMKRIACATVGAMSEGDTLEMIEFSSQTTSFAATPVAVTASLKKEAMTWLRALQARGGTEMVTGIKAALRTVREEAQRQIILVTDGLVGFERDIVSALLAGLPSSARLHAVGVGSAVNRSLVAPIARAGRGVELVVGLGEDPERAASRLFAHIVDPVVVDLSIEGACVRAAAPARLPDLFAAAPARVALEVAPAGGEIVVRGRTASGPFERRVRVPATDVGSGSPALSKLFARERVEDLEMRVASGERGVDPEIETIGKRFQISTRLTSWVAATEEATVDPRAPSRHETQPQALAYGICAEAVGLPVPRGVTSHFLGAPPQGAPHAVGFGGAAPPPPPAMRPSPSAFAPMMKARDAAEPKAAMPGRSAPLSQPVERRRAKEEAPELRGKKMKLDASASPAPAKSSTLLGRVARAVTDLFESGSDGGAKGEGGARRDEASSADAASGAGELYEPAAEDAEEHEMAAPLRTLLARLAQSNESGAVIELDLVGASWTLSYEHAEVTVTLADGSSISAALRVDRSTHAGTYAVGVRVRVVIEHALPSGASIAEIRVELPAAGAVLVARA